MPWDQAVFLKWEMVDFFEANKVMVASSTNEAFGIYRFPRWGYEQANTLKKKQILWYNYVHVHVCE